MDQGHATFDFVLFENDNTSSDNTPESSPGVSRSLTASTRRDSTLHVFAKPRAVNDGRTLTDCTRQCFTTEHDLRNLSSNTGLELVSEMHEHDNLDAEISNITSHTSFGTPGSHANDGGLPSDTELLEAGPPREPPSKIDWRRYRPIITKLYITDGKKLSEVKDIMEERYGFKATLKMYSAHRSKWKLFKHLRGEEVATMQAITKQRQDDGKRTVFVRNGQTIDFARLNRSQRRHLRYLQRSSSKPNGSQNLNNLGIVCLSPQSSPRSLELPESYRTTEFLLRSIREYMRQSLATKNCVIGNYSLQWSASTSGQRFPYGEFQHLVKQATGAHSTGDTQASLTYWREAFLNLENILYCTNPLIWIRLLDTFLDLSNRGFKDFVAAALRHVQALLSRKEVSVFGYVPVLLQLTKLTVEDMRLFINPCCELFLDFWIDVLRSSNEIPLPLMAVIDEVTNGIVCVELNSWIRRRLTELCHFIEDKNDNEINPEEFSPQVAIGEAFEHYQRAQCFSGLELYARANSQYAKAISCCEAFINHCNRLANGEHMDLLAVAHHLMALIQEEFNNWESVKAHLVMAEMWYRTLVSLNDDGYYDITLSDVRYSLHRVCNISRIADGDQKWRLLLEENYNSKHARMRERGEI